MKRITDASLLLGLLMLGGVSTARADALATRLGFVPRLAHVTEVPGSQIAIASVSPTHARRLACSSLSVNAGEACEDFEGMTTVLAWARDSGEAIAWRIEGGDSLDSIEVAPVELDGDPELEIAILVDTEGQNTRTVLVLDVGAHGLASLLCRQYDVRDVDVGEDEVALRGITASFLDVDGDGRAELRLAGEWDEGHARSAISARFSNADEEDEEHGYVVFEEALLAHTYDYYAFDVIFGRFIRMPPPSRQ